MKKNIQKASIIVGIIILPIIYSICYLNGFWDPYNSLDKVKIAIVNNDECKTNCKGIKLVNKLKENKTFAFIETTKINADKGLINKRYYGEIIIPKDFTKTLNNADKKTRKKATLEVTTNTKTSYIISQIISSATKEINKEINGEINEEITKRLTGNLYNVPKQTEKISNGLKKINSGTQTLSDGSKKLNEGTKKLYIKYQEFDNGTKDLSKGTNKLLINYKKLNDSITKVSEGTNKLKEKTQNFNELIEGLEKLKEGSNNLNTNFENYKALSNDMLENTDIAYISILEYIQNHPEAMQDENMQKAYSAAIKYHSYKLPQTDTSIINTLKNSNTMLSNGIYQINNGIEGIYNKKDDINTLNKSINDLDNYIKQINNGSNEIYQVLEKINNGSQTITTNSTKIKNGIKQINNGSQTLADGSKTLKSGINTAKNEVDIKIKETKKETEKLKGLPQYSKNPTKIKETNYGNVKDYGTFFSPYFISLSIWVGGILILMGLYYDPDERIKVLGRNSNNKKLRLLLYNIIGITQAIVLGFVLKEMLGFNVTSTPLYYLSCILISEVFLSIIIFLFFNLKDIGKFLGIAFLVVQLASCGGTFPVETEPAFYQTVSPYMPMTYSVNLLRESFVTINNSMLKDNVIVLLMIFIIFTTLSLIIDIIKNKKSIKN